MNEEHPASVEANNRVPPDRPPPFLQFSLGTMFVLTFVVAVACSVLFSMPPVGGVPLVLAFSVGLPAVLTTIIIYGSSYQRTFCIGAMFPAGVLLLLVTVLLYELLGNTQSFQFFVDRMAGPNEWFWLRVVPVGFWVSGILVGLICVGVRRLVEKRPR